MYTKGKWTVETDGDCAFRIKSDEFGGIAYLHDPLANEQGRYRELEATAHLIAAAPALLDRLKISIVRLHALKTVLVKLKAPETYYNDIDTGIAVSEEVIAAAEKH